MLYMRSIFLLAAALAAASPAAASADAMPPLVFPLCLQLQDPFPRDASLDGIWGFASSATCMIAPESKLLAGVIYRQGRRVNDAECSLKGQKLGFGDNAICLKIMP